MHVVMAVQVRDVHASSAHALHLGGPFLRDGGQQPWCPADCIHGIFGECTIRSKEWAEGGCAGHRCERREVQVNTNRRVWESLHTSHRLSEGWAVSHNCRRGNHAVPKRGKN